MLASSLKKSFDVKLFVATLIGISLVIACGCVINNYIDRGLDTKMARTKWRRQALDKIGLAQAIIYGTALGIAGFWLLIACVNLLTAIVGAVGLFFYLVMYGIWKRKSPLGTVVGSVSGAMPIVGGYTAVTNRLDGAALLLFLSMVCWQMPHFHAIAMYRYKDYKAAGLPVLPVKSGSRTAKIQILAYIAAFTITAGLLTTFGYTGYIYLVTIVLLGTIWLLKGARGFRATNDEQWARAMFKLSLIVLAIFCAAVATGALMP